jgi:hypothetical protein
MSSIDVTFPDFLDFENCEGIDAIFIGHALNPNVTPSARINNIPIELAIEQ